MEGFVNLWTVLGVLKNSLKEGLAAMENWMRKIGVAMNITELGATPEMIEGIADGTFILEGGYKVLTRDEVVQILKESL